MIPSIDILITPASCTVCSSVALTSEIAALSSSMLDAEVCGSHRPVPGLLSAELLVLVVSVSSLLANEAIVWDCAVISLVNFSICVCTNETFLFPLSGRPLLLVAPLSYRLPRRRPPSRSLSRPFLEP